MCERLKEGVEERVESDILGDIMNDLDGSENILVVGENNQRVLNVAETLKRTEQVCNNRLLLQRSSRNTTLSYLDVNL